MSFFVSESIKNVFDENTLEDQFNKDAHLYNDLDTNLPISLKVKDNLLDIDSIDIESGKITLTIDHVPSVLNEILNKKNDIKISLFGNLMLQLENVTLMFESCKKLTGNLLLVEICIIENSETTHDKN